MKRTYRFFTLALVLLLCSTLIMIPVTAADKVSDFQILEFADGSYIVVSIKYDQSESGSSLYASQSTTKGTKCYDYYNGSNELVMVFCVHGTFVYDGVTASATGATYSYHIYDNGLSFIDASASYSGATATATGRFKRLMIPNSITVSLTCSPNGVLS